MISIYRVCHFVEIYNESPVKAIISIENNKDCSQYKPKVMHLRCGILQTNVTLVSKTKKMVHFLNKAQVFEGT